MKTVPCFKRSLVLLASMLFTVSAQAGKTVKPPPAPAYTWQVDPQLAQDESWIEERRQVELVDRFLHEVLGWEAYMLNIAEGARGGSYDVFLSYTCYTYNYFFCPMWE